jgi:hypothetical protein
MHLILARAITRQQGASRTIPLVLASYPHRVTATGESGSRRSRLARSTSAPHVEPCGASLTLSGITSAAPSPKPYLPSDQTTQANPFHGAEP